MNPLNHPPLSTVGGSRLLGCALLLCATAGLAAPTFAQDASPIPEWLQQRLVDRVVHRRDSNAMMQLLQPIAGELKGSVVEVISSGRPVALGTVVSQPHAATTALITSSPTRTSLTGSADTAEIQDVYVLTKRSELSGDPIRIRLADNQLLPARVAAVRRASDLALLVVQADASTVSQSLRAVEFASEVPQIGSFIISPDRSGRVVGIGVVGAAPRKVGHMGRLGIKLEKIEQAGARVRSIIPHSGADEAGLEMGDRIIAIDGQTQSNVDIVVSTLNSMFPGEVVQLTIERDGSTVDIPAQLSEFSVMQESENDARVNGARNVRLSGFERALQHDTVLNPEQCGGPVLNTEGQVIGINIARAGRVVSYALPASLVLNEVSSMITEAGGK
ncbi:PDZ domain-containing protein [Allorhodopirellula heiligendammensis]|uniref:Serine endoprotease n=1 Tax=Allorhodopirellula heiligendammensis TaxID=2714739 RepID=A0A5C6BH53_9BACT|nr:PDZ domain-containing protein [Allorhodopirellula heiligendammensis]TWU10997.1 serine endoprotease [Allorhodopirellula heiligendammensis]